MTFGEKVVQIRKRLKMSQEDLAKKIGTSAPVVGRYERNEIRPSIGVAAKIADALDVTIDFLAGRAEEAIGDKKIMRRIQDIENLSEEDKERLYHFIDMTIRDAKAKRAYAS